MSGAQGESKDSIEKRIRGLVGTYMDNPDSKALGMPASEWCSVLEELADIDSGGAQFKKFNPDKPDYVLICKTEKDQKVVTMNRRYNDGHSLAGLGLIRKLQKGEKDYDIFVASSEIARNSSSAIYDLAVKVRDNKSGKAVEIPVGRYPIQDRRFNASFVDGILNYITDNLRQGKSVYLGGIRTNMRETGEEFQFYSADARVRDIKDPKLKFVLVPETGGFRVCYETEKPWDTEVHFNGRYDKKLYENCVHDVLHLEGNPQNQLDVCMILLNNKERLEKRAA